MKKSFSKIKWFFVMAFATITSFVSKVMWQAIESWGSKPSLRWQSYYWVEMPQYLRAEWPGPFEYSDVPSQFSIILDAVVKCFEIVLFAAIFIFWIIGYLRIRKIEDKNLKNSKFKRMFITVFILFVIWTLVWLWYCLYKQYAW